MGLLRDLLKKEKVKRHDSSIARMAKGCFNRYKKN